MFIFNSLCAFVPVWGYGHVSAAGGGGQNKWIPLSWCVGHLWAALCGYWKLNPCLLEEQEVLSTSKPSLQPKAGSFLLFLPVICLMSWLDNGSACSSFWDCFKTGSFSRSSQSHLVAEGELELLLLLLPPALGQQRWPARRRSLLQPWPSPAPRLGFSQPWRLGQGLG